MIELTDLTREGPLFTVKERFILDVLNDWIDIVTIKSLLPTFKYIRIKWDTTCIYKALKSLRQKGIVETKLNNSTKGNQGPILTNNQQGGYYRIKDKWRHLL